MQDISSEEKPNYYMIQFHGNLREYFQLWVVNLCLSLVTLGIYSAWAKVKNHRYFYGNTEMNGGRFDYHARPLEILVGRIIALIFLLSYSILFKILGAQSLIILFIVILLLFPWMIIKQLSYNAAMTSYKNVHFHFSGTYGKAFFAYIFMGFFTLMTFGLLYSVWTKKYLEFFVNNHSYGKSKMKGTYSALDFFILSCITFLLASSMYFFATVIFGLSGYFISEWAAPLNSKIIEVISFMLGLSAFPLATLYVYAYYRIEYLNIIFRGISLETDGIQLVSDLKVKRFYWLLLSNFLAILFSVGLLTPWARLRTHHYYCNHLLIEAKSPIPDFEDQEKKDHSSVAEEVTSAFNIDIGF